MSDVRDIDIDLIKIDAEIQPREALDTATLIVLRERYQEDRREAFPPVVVYRDAEGVHWLADGHYRVQAVADALGIERPRTIRAEIRDGSRRDAIFYAAEANAKHGTPLTAQEKRRVVIRLLQDGEWGQMSDNAIARHVGVSNGFVSTIHRELDSEQASLHDAKVNSEPRTVTYRRGGKEIRMKKGNIGRSRGSQAKTTPPNTVPDSPAIIQYERPTDEDEAPQIDDSREAVEADTTMSSNGPTDVESNSDDTLEAVPNDAAEAVTTEGFTYLQVSWESATDEDRHAFLIWIKADQDQKRWHEAADSALKSLNLTRDHLR